MAILIKGMDMPIGCVACEFNVSGKCVVMGRRLTVEESGFYEIYDFCDKVSDDCPLVEIPKGAMLIDANEIEEKISFGLQEPDYQHECESWVMGLLMARDYVENASIIFEGDEE